MKKGTDNLAGWQRAIHETAAMTADKAAAPVGAVPQGDYAAIDAGDGTVRVIQLSRTGSDPAMTGDERIMLQQQAALASQAARMGELSAKWRGQAAKLRRLADGIGSPEILLREAKEIDSYADELDAAIDNLHGEEPNG